MKIKLFSLLLAITLLISCGKSAPKGDDTEVKKNIISLIKKTMSEQLSTNAFGGFESAEKPFNLLNVADEIFKTTKNVYKEKTNQEWPGVFDETNEQSDQFEAIKKEVRDSSLNLLISSLKIENVRIISKNDEIRKGEYQCDIYQENTKIQTISYSAQYTEDDKLYVTINSFSE